MVEGVKRNYLHPTEVKNLEETDQKWPKVKVLNKTMVSSLKEMYAKNGYAYYTVKYEYEHQNSI